MGKMKLELSESGPSKIEWLLAFLLMVIPFMSFCYSDTAFFIMYELRFAQAILNGNLKEAYEPIVKVMASSGAEVSNLSYYDLPLNLVFGIWGIPLYLYCSRNGTLEITFPQSFWQMLYGKSILLIAFIISAVLVYKICTALDVDRNRSRWGAYIYFSSAMAVTAVGIIGQCDVFAICLTLLGVLAYIRNQDKKFLLWFVIAAQFKQFAVFVFMPLMLLRDKNLLRATGRMLVIVAVGTFCNVLIRRASPYAFTQRTWFTLGKTTTLFNLDKTLSFFNGNVSLFIFALGLLCVYCWFHEYKDKTDKSEVNTQIVFVTLLSMVLMFTSFPSFPYWFMHMTPYLAIAAVYHFRNTERILLFEAVGMAAVIFLNYIIYDWCYTPNNAVNMLIHNALGNPELKNINAILNGAVTMKRLHNPIILTSLESIYCVCMYALVYLAYPKKYVQGGGALRQIIRYASFAV